MKLCFALTHLLVFAAATALCTDFSGLISYVVSEDPAKGVAVAITNAHTSALTALLVETRQYTNNQKLRAIHATYQDVYVNVNHDAPLAPGATRNIQLLVSNGLKEGGG